MMRCERSDVPSTTILKRNIKNSVEFTREAQTLIAQIKEARVMKSSFMQNHNAQAEVEVSEPIEKTLPTIEDLNRTNSKIPEKKRASRAERVNEKLNLYRHDPEARNLLAQRTLECKVVCAREILDRNICSLRSLSPEVRLDRIAAQANKASEHRSIVLKNCTEMHERMHLHWLNEPHNRIMRLREEAKRAKMEHYFNVFNAFFKTISSILVVTDILHSFRAIRIRKNAELGILKWIRTWKSKKRVKSALVIQRCHGAFRQRKALLNKSSDIIKFVLKHSKIAIMAKNALDRMRGRMVEVRAHWRMNKAIRWFKYRIILYQLTMFDSERLRRVRETGKTHQTILKEKAVSSVSVIMNSSGVHSGSSQLQSFVTTLSSASVFIAAGLRLFFFAVFCCLISFFPQKPKVDFEASRICI
jgi:hypothetical protein